MSSETIEWIGYTASFFVAASFIFKNVTTLRWVNLIGCSGFVIYGFLIDSYPVIITNLFIFFVNLYHLFTKKEVAVKQ